MLERIFEEVGENYGRNKFELFSIGQESDDPLEND
jgi:hypothetical protein